MNPVSIRKAIPLFGLKLNFLIPSSSVVFRSFAVSNLPGSSAGSIALSVAGFGVEGCAPFVIAAEGGISIDRSPSSSLFREEIPAAGESLPWSGKVTLDALAMFDIDEVLIAADDGRPAHATSERMAEIRHSKLCLFS